MKKFSVNPSIQKELNSFIQLLCQKNTTVKEVVLFGSYAKETFRPDSDIDVAVIATNFGQDEIQEIMDLRKLAIQVSDRITPIPLNKKYMKMKYHPFIGEIKRYGQIVYKAP